MANRAAHAQRDLHFAGEVASTLRGSAAEAISDGGHGDGLGKDAMGGKTGAEMGRRGLLSGGEADGGCDCARATAIRTVLEGRLFAVLGR